MTEPTLADATASGDDSHPCPICQQTMRQPDPQHLQAELLVVQESLDTLAHLMRDSRSQTASLSGIAGLLDSMSSQVADVSLQLAA